MATIDPGKRDQRIVIRSVPTTKSASGADLRGDPLTVARVYAAIKPAITGSKREFYTAEKLTTRTLYELEFPYIEGLNETMEILWEARGVVLDILEVHDLGGRPLNIKLTAQEQR